MPFVAKHVPPRTVASRAELLARGMHPRTLASSQIRDVLPGFVTRADAPADLHAIATTLQTSVRPGAVIGDVTALELYGFPLPPSLAWAAGEPVHCIVPAGSAYTSRLLVVHLAQGAPTVEFAGLTMLRAASALRRAARRLSHGDLVACLDALLGGRTGIRPPPLADVRETVAALVGPGSAKVRRAAEDARENVWSPMETRARLLLLDDGMPEPEKNHRVLDPATGRAYYIDLAYPQWLIAIEYDGDHHRSDKVQWQEDLHKNEVLHQLGFAVLRISIADYREPGDFLQRLAHAIATYPQRRAQVLAA